jgi:CheY-like chemotaxis protein
MFEVITAINGQQAIQKFTERNFSHCGYKFCKNYKFTLILMDIQMPVLDGI